MISLKRNARLDHESDKPYVAADGERGQGGACSGRMWRMSYMLSGTNPHDNHVERGGSFLLSMHGSQHTPVVQLIEMYRMTH